MCITHAYTHSHTYTYTHIRMHKHTYTHIQCILWYNVYIMYLFNIPLSIKFISTTIYESVCAIVCVYVCVLVIVNTQWKWIP